MATETSIPELELHPDEHNRLVLLWAAMQRKYMGLPDTATNLLALANEFEGRARDEIQLVVVVDIANMEMGDDGRMYVSPIVTPIKRVEDLPFDFERSKYEEQNGFRDGVPGKFDTNGRWTEPSKPVGQAGAVLLGGSGGTASSTSD